MYSFQCQIIQEIWQKATRKGGWNCANVCVNTPFSFSPNMVRKTVKLMGPLASFTMASSSSFFTFSWPMVASTSLRSSLLMMPSLFWSMIVKACRGTVGVREERLVGDHWFKQWKLRSSHVSQVLAVRLAYDNYLREITCQHKRVNVELFSTSLST